MIGLAEPHPKTTKIASGTDDALLMRHGRRSNFSRFSKSLLQLSGASKGTFCGFFRQFTLLISTDGSP
jgi:hypothetical protein